METIQRKITLYTPDKVYAGYMDISNESLRTIDLLNSANMYWKDPAEKSFEDALLLHKASIILEGNTNLGSFGKLQIKLSDILFFYDTLVFTGNAQEKMRAATLKEKAKEETSTVHIITHTRGDAFFYISGTFYGLFRNKSKHRYIPLTEAVVTEVIRHGEKWQKKQISIDNRFIGVGSGHIEACSFES